MSVYIYIFIFYSGNNTARQLFDQNTKRKKRHDVVTLRLTTIYGRHPLRHRSMAEQLRA